jgi:hypothetical protein
MVVPDRCPRCAALVRADAAWCGLCHADLRPAPAQEPTPAAPPVVVTGPETVVQPVAASMPATDRRVDPDELLALLVAAGGSGASAAQPAAARRRGRHARPDPEGTDLDPAGSPPAPEASGVVETGPLAGVDLSVLATPASDPVSAWSRRLQTPGAKVAVMVGGVAIVGVLGLLMLTIAGLVLG